MTAATVAPSADAPGLADDQRARSLEVVGLAAGAGVSPSQLLSVALATIDADSIDDALAQLMAMQADINQVVADTPCPPTALARPPAGDPRARMRLDIRDHEVRDRLLYGELLPANSLMQVIALAIGDVQLSDSDAALMEKVTICGLVADPRIWPLAIARRLHTMGRSFAAQVMAGVASTLSPHFGPLPTAKASTVYERVFAAHERGLTTAAWVDEVVARKEHLPGFGRPVIQGRDERCEQILPLAEAYGRHDGRHMRLAAELERLLVARKGVYMNASGMYAALLRDLGFAAGDIAGMVQLMLDIALLMHATWD